MLMPLMDDLLSARLLRALLLSLGLAFGCVADGYAQLPTSLLPAKPSAPAAKTEAPADPSAVLVKERDAAQARLVEARDAMNRIQRQMDVTPQKPNVARNELLQQFNQRQMLVDRYAQQVDYLKQLQVLDQKIANARQKVENWQPPAGVPPWPILEGDQVRNEMLLKQTQLRQLEKQSGVIAEQIVMFSREKSDAEVRLRQVQDAQSKIDAAKLSQQERQALEDAKLALALKAAILLRADLERRLNERESTLLKLHIETAESTMHYFDGRFTLSPDVLATAKSDLQAAIDRDRTREYKALAEADVALKQLTQAQESLQKLEARHAPERALAEGRTRLTIAQANEEAARSHVDRLRQLIEIGTYAQSLWDVRAELYGENRPNAARLDDLAEKFKLGLIRVRQSRDNLQQTLMTREQEAFDLREAALTVQTPLEKQAVTARLNATNAQADGARLVLAALDKFEQFLQLVQVELGLKDRNGTLGERALAFWQRTDALAKSAWQYELFTVDDSVIADGKEIKAVRSVTVGKSVGAIGLLVFGFLLLSWLIRAVIAEAEHRIGLKASVATQIRRWLMLLATGSLIILSFNLVQIPLSVFAFLGGALAIGAGFGTQNLLKNLISGVMLLIERPIRLGDLVEIDGVKGRVTSIGIRFSTVHSPDGVDTLIPNSELVEKKLVNWTYSSPEARREIRVGVSYSADPARVADLLRAAALAHPKVMREPMPVVTLDDFAESALVFTLRFWVRLGPGLDGRVVDSDLRCTILDQLGQAGIEIPYPQRDIHIVAAEGGVRNRELP